MGPTLFTKVSHKTPILIHILTPQSILVVLILSS